MKLESDKRVVCDGSCSVGYIVVKDNNNNSRCTLNTALSCRFIVYFRWRISAGCNKLTMTQLLLLLEHRD